MPATLNFPPVTVTGRSRLEHRCRFLATVDLSRACISPTTASMVCRTDVGNIYRWSGLTLTDYMPIRTKKWVPLLTLCQSGRQGTSGWRSNHRPQQSRWLGACSFRQHRAMFTSPYSRTCRTLYQTWLWYRYQFQKRHGIKVIFSLRVALLRAMTAGILPSFPTTRSRSTRPTPTSPIAACRLAAAIRREPYTSLNQAGGSTLATWISVKTSGATPVGGVTNTMSCGLAIDASGNGGTLSPPTTTVGGSGPSPNELSFRSAALGFQNESTNGGVTFTEIAAGPMGTGNFYVVNGGFTAAGVYYCIVCHATAGGIWRYKTGTWTNITAGNMPALLGNLVRGITLLIIDPRNTTAAKSYLGVSGPNGIGVGFSISTTADTGTTSGMWTLEAPEGRFPISRPRHTILAI